ncbi:hypothetical protein BH18THE2_BH18THE2_31340 [soil metagenome]
MRLWTRFPSLVAFEDRKEMAALLAKTQTFEQRLKMRYLDIKTGVASRNNKEGLYQQYLQRNSKSLKLRLMTVS